MPFEPTIGAEPIAGYQLIERLGTGGYGAVWKVTAPGGLTKAVKIVFGDLSGHQAEQELKALGRIKEVRHPFLLSLERFEVLDGQLFIVTELADKSLLDRFNECREKGLPGIPRDELLPYLRDAAEALDYMSDTHGLQHLDIKPQNLLLVGGRIKVADFGLVKELVGTSMTATGGVTPIYATPEAFDGRISRHSDQYSLAVVYQEMLTGVRPFPGTTILQLAAQHMSGRPLLDPLPPSDRLAIGRALSKIPEKRFPTSREMVESLLRGKDIPAFPPASKADNPIKPRASKTPISSRTPAPSQKSNGNLPQPTAVGIEVAAILQSVALGPPQRTKRIPLPGPIVAASPSDKAKLQPALFLGVGNQGCLTLRHVKERLTKKFGNVNDMPVFRFIQVDTDRTDIKQSHQDGTSSPLMPEETVLAALGKPDHYRDKSKQILKWLDRRWLFGIPRSLATEGIRPLGHLAFVDHAEEIKDKLHAALASMTSDETLEKMEQQGFELRNPTPRVYLVASIAGATGGGMVVGMAYLIQQILTERNLAANELCGILLHSTSPKPAENELSCINARATLEELKHFSNPAHAYPGDPAHGLAAFDAEAAPFENCYLVHLGDQLPFEEVATATANVAEYLFLDAATEAGAFFDQHRAASRCENRHGDGCLTLRSFGLFRGHLPRNELIQQATLLFCRNLVSKWPGEQSEFQKERIEKQAEKLAVSLGIQEDSLVAKFHSFSEQALGEELEAFFTKLLGPPSGDSIKPNSTSPGRESAKASLKAVDGLLGRGQEGAGDSYASTSSFEKALDAKAKEVSQELAASLLEWLHQIVEDPAHRLKTAENAAGWLTHHMLTGLENVRKQSTQLRQFRDGLRQRIDNGGQLDKLSGIRWLNSVRRQPQTTGASSRALEYCWVRLGEIALKNTQAVLSSLYHEVTNFAQDLVISRHKLAQFVSLFDSDRATNVPASRSRGTANCIELLPAKATGVSEAAARIIKNLPAELTRRVEENFQTEVLDCESGLWGMLTGGEDLLRRREEQRATSSVAFWDLVSKHADLAQGYKDKLLLRARPFLVKALEELDSAQLFLQSADAPNLVEDALNKYITLAQPKPCTSGGWKHLLLTLPDSPAGKELHEMINACVPDVPTTLLYSEEDLLLCFEVADLPIDEIMEALTGQEPHYARLAQRVLTRIDIPWSVPCFEET
jgi:eukaryotic-like serine/threonine-protein kinase